MWTTRRYEAAIIAQDKRKQLQSQQLTQALRAEAEAKAEAQAKAEAAAATTATPTTALSELEAQIAAFEDGDTVLM